jgi:uncharacterized iron-regulated membrane protein
VVAPRAIFKSYHRFNFLGPYATLLNGIAGLGFSILIITGLIQYVRLYKARARAGHGGLFWVGGSVWRYLHRAISVGASILVIWVTITGLLLSYDNFEGPVVRLFQPRAEQGPRGPNPLNGDFSTPLKDAELPAMTQATLASFRRLEPNTGIKVLRLRYFAGYSQGIVVAADADTSQLVFNTLTGKRMSMSEKGYPTLGFAFGWERHQMLKRLHRGDFFGMPGRWLASAGGLAMLYLILSGLVMYWQLWSRRAKTGKTSPIWK